jgi:hypothetical protein
VIELPLPDAPPEAPLCDGADQLKVAPDTLLDKLIAVEPPEQIVCAGGVATTDGTGFTVTVTLTGLPGHPLAEGVTEYVAVPPEVPVLFKI